MRQILILIFLISAVVACAQETPFADLPSKGSTSGGDEMTIVASAIPYRMTYSVLFAATNAELGVIDDSITNYDLRLLALEAGGAGVWTKSSTNLSPTTSGDDILLAVSTERIIFGDADTYIFENSDDELYFHVGGTDQLHLNLAGIGFNNNLVAFSSKTYDLGSASVWWDNGYFDRLYVDAVGNYIDVAASDLTFTSTAAGTYSLTQLAASGSSDSLWTSITTDTIFGNNIHYFGDGDSYIRESSDDNLELILGGVSIWTTSSAGTFGRQLSPNVNHSWSLGNSSAFWGTGYIDNIFFENVSTSIDKDGSNNLTFTDANTGTKTLAELDGTILVENAQTGTTYTLVLTDVGKGVTLTNAAAITMTVPPNSSVAFPTGTTIIISQGGAGTVTVAEGAGVTINSFGSALDLAGIYAYATLRKMATDTWELFGNIQ